MKVEVKHSAGFISSQASEGDGGDIYDNPEANDSPLVENTVNKGIPGVITFQDVCSAAYKIRNAVLKTPCTRSHISSLTGCDVFFKKDYLQYTGSFKERGACYALMMLTEDQRHLGVIAASAGNHALALAYHGQRLSIPVVVVMPKSAPIMKVKTCSQFGAQVIVKGDNLSQCKDFAMELVKEKGYIYINGYDHPHVIAGQGTMGLEVCEQVPDLDAILIPVGGGGLAAGVAVALRSLRPGVAIVGVESERCASFTSALKTGRPVSVDAEPTLADGLAVPVVGETAFATAAPLLDKVIVVKEEFIALAILRLVELEKSVVEGAGAVGLAALLQGLLPELKGKRVVVPLCGGNIDTTVLGRCLERGLAADNRLVKLAVRVSDRPGGIAQLTSRMAALGVSIKDIVHERAWLSSEIFSVEVKVVCEVRDGQHAQELEAMLNQHYNHVCFGPRTS